MKYYIWISFTFLFVSFSCSKSETGAGTRPETIKADILKTSINVSNLLVGEQYDFWIYYTRTDCYEFERLEVETLDPINVKYKIWLKLIKSDCSDERILDSLLTSFSSDVEGMHTLTFVSENDFFDRLIPVGYPLYSFEMAPDDHQLIVDSVKNNPEISHLVDTYGTTEYYYGASGHYGSYDMRVSKRIEYDEETYGTLSNNGALELMWSRLEESIPMVIINNYPNMKLYDRFEVSYDTYFDNYIYNSYIIKFQCMQISPNFEFTKTKGPTPVFK